MGNILNFIKYEDFSHICSTSVLEYTKSDLEQFVQSIDLGLTVSS